jgi:hypothetical protein
LVLCLAYFVIYFNDFPVVQSDKYNNEKYQGGYSEGYWDKDDYPSGSSDTIGLDVAEGSSEEVSAAAASAKVRVLTTSAHIILII